MPGDANNYGDVTDPRNSYYSADPEHWVYANGRWQYRNSKASGEAHPTGPTQITGNAGPVNPLDMAGMIGDWVTSGDPWHNKHALNILDTGPGSRIDYEQSNDDVTRMGPLIDQLKQQAQTGSGAWEQALKGATDRSKANAMSLGQSSQSGAGYADRLGAIGNAQAGADQRAAGQGNILRAQQQQDAARQQGQILGQQGGMEAQAAGNQAGTRQAVREAKEATNLEHRKMAYNVLGGGAQAAGTIAAMFLSDGGKVSGKAHVFGDDEENDTVPAMLSPGEIVVPRSAADSPEKAEHFIRAVMANHGRARHLDGGGDVDPGYEEWIRQHGGRGSQTIGDPVETDRENRQAYEDSKHPKPIIIPAANPGGGATNLGPAGDPKNAPSFLFGASAQNPTADNGGMLDLSRYNDNRNAVFKNADFFANQAAGKGPSAVPQMTQNSADDAMIAALRKQSGRGGPLGDELMGSVDASSDAAGRAGAQAGNEQHQGQEAFTQALMQQRARDMGVAQAQQQAQWRNTMMNAGLDAANQAQIRNLVGGAGQAAMGVADMLAKNSGGQQSSFSSNSSGGGRQAIDDAFNFDDTPMREGDGSGGPVSSSDVGDWNTGPVDSATAAHGGEIVDEDKRARDFIAALRRAA